MTTLPAIAAPNPDVAGRLQRLIDDHEVGRQTRAGTPLEPELKAALEALGYADPGQ